MSNKLSDFFKSNKETSGKDALAARIITVKAGETIPCDGEVIDGFAMVDESAVAGVSTPAMIEAAPGRNRVLADTVIIEGSLTIRCNPR